MHPLLFKPFKPLSGEQELIRLSMSTTTHYNLISRTNVEVKGNIPIHYLTYYEGPIDIDFPDPKDSWNNHLAANTIEQKETLVNNNLDFKLNKNIILTDNSSDSDVIEKECMRINYELKMQGENINYIPQTINNVCSHNPNTYSSGYCSMSVDDKYYCCLFDSCSSTNVMSESVARRLCTEGHITYLGDTEANITGAHGEKIEKKVSWVKGSPFLNPDWDFRNTIFVVFEDDKCHFCMLFGMDFMAHNLISLDYSSKILEMNHGKLSPLGVLSNIPAYREMKISEWRNVNNNIYKKIRENEPPIVAVPEFKAELIEHLDNIKLKNKYLNKPLKLDNFDIPMQDYLQSISDLPTSKCVNMDQKEILGDKLDFKYYNNMKDSDLAYQSNVKILESRKNNYLNSINKENFDKEFHIKFVTTQAIDYEKIKNNLINPDLSSKEINLAIKFSKKLDSIKELEDLKFDDIVEKFKFLNKDRKLTDTQELLELNSFIWNSKDLYYREKKQILKFYLRIDKMEFSKGSLSYVGNLNELKEKQLKDPILEQVIDKLKIDDNGRWNKNLISFAHAKQSLYLKDGLLIWYNRNKDLILPVVPKDTLVHILSQEHASDHNGKKKAIKKIKEAIYFPTLDEIALKISSTCFKCQTTKVHAIKNNPKIPFMKVTALNSLDLVYADCTFLGTTADGYIGTINFIDNASRYAFAVPIKSRNSAHLISQVIPQLKQHFGNGVIKYLRLDNAAEFSITADFAKYFVDQGTKVIYGTPYVSYSAGLVERLNQEMKSKLRALRDEDNKIDWVRQLPKVMLKYNNESHDKHGLTPSQAFLIFQKLTNDETELQYEQLNEEDLTNNRMSYFKIGDYVLKKFNKLGNRKEYALADCFSGPYKILEIKDNNKRTFILELYNNPAELMLNATYKKCIGTFTPLPCREMDEIPIIPLIPSPIIANSPIFSTPRSCQSNKSKNLNTTYDEFDSIEYMNIPNTYKYKPPIHKKMEKLPTSYCKIDNSLNSYVHNLKPMYSDDSFLNYSGSSLEIEKENRKNYGKRPSLPRKVKKTVNYNESLDFSEY
ncbi:unnamed protein product [Rotaria socialis]|uniref:Integrase catalytic domain-containing protein n=1 Tax=Rotaria socialis TaxID=392032 RepID=A0A821SC24_9BILA|nr:unnamed protein product [Rotaria socialis]